MQCLVGFSKLCVYLKFHVILMAIVLLVQQEWSSAHVLEIDVLLPFCYTAEMVAIMLTALINIVF